MFLDYSIFLQHSFIETHSIISHYNNKWNRKSIYNTNNEIIQLNSFEVPTSIDFVDKIDLTEADKIDYKKYEKMAEEEYNLERKVKTKKLEKLL